VTTFSKSHIIFTDDGCYFSKSTSFPPVHNFLVIWGGLSPDLLSKISTYPELCREAERVLESMYCASLPREVHAQDLIDKELRQYYNSSKQFGKRKPTISRAMSVTPCPLNDRDSFLAFSNACICRSGIHTHCLTCHKPPKGYTGCRLCRPAGMVESTGPVELVDVTPPPEIQDNGGGKSSKKEIVYNILPESDITPSRQICEDDDESQVSEPDSRLIVWEIKRPILDGLPTPSSLEENCTDEEKKCDDAADYDGEEIEDDDNSKSQSAKEWYVKELEKAMKVKAPLPRNKEVIINNTAITSFVARDEADDKEHQVFCNNKEDHTDHCVDSTSPAAMPTIDRQADLVLYDPERDGNCLFKAVLRGLHEINFMTNVTDPSILRKETMQYLSDNRQHNVGLFSLEDLAMMQANDVNKQIESHCYYDNDVSREANEFDWKIPIVSLDDYIRNMKIDTPYKCCWGDSLEIRLMSKVYSVNIAVYEEKISNECCSEVILRECFEQGPEYPTINILYTDECTHYKTILAPRPNANYISQGSDPFLSSSIETELVQQLMLELRGLRLKDLKNLYLNVSESLKERNGMVADFNVLLTALMSCNTNSLFLGSREQSKGALFYIGPYICKNGVQIIDSFDLLIEAQDYARKYPSTAEDATTDKRFVQYVLTRVLNKMNSLMEVSDTQAAAALLGMNAGMCSDIFVSYDANNYLHHILEEKKYGEGGCNKMDDDDEENDDDDDDESLASFIVNDDENNSTCSGSGGNVEQEEESSSEEMVLNHSERSEADCPFELVSGLETGGCSTRFSCPIFKVDEGKRLEAVPLPDLYRYRGKELSKLSRFEHRTQVKVEKKTLDDDDISDDKKSNRGRKKSKGFEFASGFILQPSQCKSCD
jgi:hypothetical protein